MKKLFFMSKILRCRNSRVVKNQTKLDYDPKNREDYRMKDYHVSVNEETVAQMLKETFNMNSRKELIDAVIPKALQINTKAGGEEFNMMDVRSEMKGYMNKNQIFKSYIGQGFHPTLVPPIIKRSVLENPRWYTAYTPYQPEISQGRLEASFNYQIMIMRLTEMEFANSSLLDEASAAGECMLMAWRIGKKKKNTFLVDSNLFDASVEVIKGYAVELGIKVVVADLNEEVVEEYKDDLFGVVLQTPNKRGVVSNYSELISKVHQNNAIAVVGTDLLASVICKTPGAMGADITYGNGQRFGTPMGFGGPHAAFFAAKMKYIRETPGRIIGLARDTDGNDAYRISLTTREQHIRREKATSNICTSQVLLANLNFFYALFHKEKGLKSIAKRVNYFTQKFAKLMSGLGYKVVGAGTENISYFDTVVVEFENSDEIISVLQSKKINAWRIDENQVSFSFNEVTTEKDIKVLVRTINSTIPSLSKDNITMHPLRDDLKRDGDRIFKDDDIINKFQGEHELLRYLTRLENKDLTLANSMIPLGSCTMKLNSAFNMEWIGDERMDIHPFAHARQAIGYYQMMSQLSNILCNLTGMDAITYQPNSGASGEYAGLAAFKKYFESKGESNRNIVLIPVSAHGTNPASAAKMGLKIYPIKSREDGCMDIEDLREKITKSGDDLMGMMITYPSTHGVFEEETLDCVKLVRDAGGLIYTDGANMNAQMNMSAPGIVGDICHLNLHKTFTIPHGGGGPGVGPICVKDFLTEFLPSHTYFTSPVFKKAKNFKAEGKMISNSPFSSASILSITYMYIRTCGRDVLKECSFVSILNSNYLRVKLAPYYDILYTNKKGFVAHEFILDIRPIKKRTGISEEDIAKRLMDYGFHAPTQSFPVAGTLMIEPTESECKEELDNFIDAMICIRKEIDMVESGEYDKLDNPLKKAPHTLQALLSDNWDRSYSRAIAAYPTEFVRKRDKVWPAVGRIDGISGDRNLRLEYES